MKKLVAGDLLSLERYSRERTEFRATSLETLRQMVAAGLGITLLPDLATRGPFGSGQGLAVKEFARPVPTRTVGAVWRKSTSRTEAINADAHGTGWYCTLRLSDARQVAGLMDAAAYESAIGKA